MINKKGYTIIEILVATALLSLGIGGFIAFSQVVNQTQAKKTLENIIENKKNLIVQNLNTRISWVNTVTLNNIACLKSDGGNCTAVGAPFPLAVADGNGVVLTSVDANNVGFDKNGATCVYGAGLCHYRFLVFWAPVCENGVTCKAPIIQITALFQTTAEGAIQVPTASVHDFNYIRGSFTISSKENCQSIGGTFDDVNSKCLLPNNNQRCPDGSIVKGIRANGTINCQPLINSQCALGEYAKGVNPDGTLLCHSLAGACTGVPPNGYNLDPNSGYSIGVSGGGDCGDGGGDCGN